MWQLQSDKDGKRVYRNSVTNSECVQNKCYTDQEGNIWFEFTDLITLPFTRNFAANKVTSLFSLGLTPDDANQFFTKHKSTLRSKDNGEKYEQAYSETLDFENKFKSATDPVKQMSSLVCVYFTINDEPIDSFSGDIQAKKMSLLEADPAMHAFFLARQVHLIESSQLFFSQISQTVSPLPVVTDTN